MSFSIIAAIDDNFLIGKDDGLPWHLPEDFKHFKATTMGGVIIMGRKTFESLPVRPLKGRTNIVVSRTTDEIDGAYVMPSVEEALTLAETFNTSIYVIGGQAIYEQTINNCNKMVITHVDGTHEGNYHFPRFGDEWGVSNVLQTGANFKIIEYVRVG